MDTAKAIGIIIENPKFADVSALWRSCSHKEARGVHHCSAHHCRYSCGGHHKLRYHRRGEKEKVGVRRYERYPGVAVVDPDMMSSMPKGLTAATGMDALTHAIEGYITKGDCVISDMFHLEAIKLISREPARRCAEHPGGPRGHGSRSVHRRYGLLQRGPGHCPLHGTRPVALYDTPHGVANAIILPTVMEYNAPATGEKYRDIAKAMGVKGTDDMTQDEYRKVLVDAVKRLASDAYSRRP